MLSHAMSICQLFMSQYLTINRIIRTQGVSLAQDSHIGSSIFLACYSVPAVNVNYLHSLVYS